MRFDVHELIQRHYAENNYEDGRLWATPRGKLIRLRTWDIFERFVPPRARVVDIGGGPGTHASWLARSGRDVALLDPIARHVARARERAVDDGVCFTAQEGEARHLPWADRSADVALLMGPLYHLVDASERARALREVQRVLVPGGLLIAETINRAAWLFDATLKGLLADQGQWPSFERTLTTGLTQDPSAPQEGFYAYFHQPDELRAELTDAGFEVISLIGVEGHAWLLGDLEQQLTPPEPLLRALRMIESDPSLLGVHAHLIAVARRLPTPVDEDPIGRAEPKKVTK